MGPSASTGRKVRPATIRITPSTRPVNSGVSVGKVPAVDLDPRLAHERAGDGQRRDHEEEPADQHAQPERRLVPLAGHGEAGEGRAVVVGRRGEGVDDLGQAVRAGVEPAGQRRLQDHRRRGEHQHGERHGQDVEHHQLHLGGLDLLAEVLRVFVRPSGRR